MIEIKNRRYIGCKNKLLDFIYDSVKDFGYDNKCVFADLFGGTGVVAHYFAKQGYKIIINDTLYSNYVAYQAWFNKTRVNEKKLIKLIDKFNGINPKKLKPNYFSKIYGNKYYSVNDAKKIGFIREAIEKSKKDLTQREYFILLTSLMYCADKIANTVGHFEYFLSQKPKDKGVNLETLDISHTFLDAEIFQEDANLLVKKIKCDIAYIDPPYNARQYVNFYHVLENLARWDKPKIFEGNSMKFKRNELKSGYCRANSAPTLFEGLINKLDSKLIVVSYNNTYKANSTSSINTIDESTIKRILRAKGKLSIREISYKYFNSGKTNFTNHKEILYICEVKR